MQFPYLWTDHCPKLLRAFNSKHVEYLLIGSMAKSYYSKQKCVNDMDLMINCTPENAREVRPILSQLGEDMDDEEAKKLVKQGVYMSLFGDKAVASPEKAQGSVTILTPPKHEFIFGEAFSRSTRGIVRNYEIPVRIASMYDLELLDSLRQQARQRAPGDPSSSAL